MILKSLFSSWPLKTSTFFTVHCNVSIRLQNDLTLARRKRRCQGRTCSRPIEVFRLHEGAALDLDTTDLLQETAISGPKMDLSEGFLLEKEQVEGEAQEDAIMLHTDIMVGGEEAEGEVQEFTVEVDGEGSGRLDAGFHVSMDEGQYILLHEDVLQTSCTDTTTIGRHEH